jgi:hypothetical protein
MDEYESLQAEQRWSIRRADDRKVGQRKGVKDFLPRDVILCAQPGYADFSN